MWTLYEVLHIKEFQGNFCFDYNRLRITGQSQPWGITEQVHKKTYWKKLRDSRKLGEPGDCDLIGIQVSSCGLFVLFLISVYLVALKGEIAAGRYVLCRKPFEKHDSSTLEHKLNESPTWDSLCWGTYCST